MAATFRTASSAGTASGTVPLIVNRPTGTVDNDLLVAFASCYSSQIISPPGGWTPDVFILSATPQFLQLRSYVKLAASEPASYSWGLSASKDLVVGILRIDGQHLSTPVDVSAEFADPDTNDLIATAPSVITNFADDLLITAHAATTNPARTFTPPSGMTERVDVQSTSSPDVSPIGMEICTQLLAASGATGVRDATASGTLQIGSLGLTLAIRAFVAGTPSKKHRILPRLGHYSRRGRR